MLKISLLVIVIFEHMECVVLVEMFQPKPDFTFYLYIYIYISIYLNERQLSTHLLQILNKKFNVSLIKTFMFF